MALLILITHTPLSAVMNAGGVPYEISNTKEKYGPGWRGTPGTYSTDFTKNAGGGQVEYFDAYAEIQTQYSQVYWTRNDPIPIPAALQLRFKDNVMVITGYEVDQVTHTKTGAEEVAANPSREGLTGEERAGAALSGFSCYPSCGASDKSVPIYHAYNHHYFGWLQGNESEMYETMTPRHAPNPSTTAFKAQEDATTDYPTYLVFKENPGGEYRKSYHGFPAGHGMLLHSPENFICEPMQIDTHNRAYGITENEGFVADFLPAQDTANNMTEHNAMSPLIECPCSDRITKKVVQDSVVIVSGTCAKSISSEAECAAAVATSVGAVAVASSMTSDASLPKGCIMRPVSKSKSKPAAAVYVAIFNTIASTAKTCSTAEKIPVTNVTFSSMPKTQLNCPASGCSLPIDAAYGCTPLLNQCSWADAATARTQCAAWEACHGFMCSAAFTGTPACFARGAGAETQTNNAADTWVKQNVAIAMQGATNLASGLVNITVEHDGVTATLTLSGPSTRWYAAGFAATSMADTPYTIVVDGSGAVTERILASHAPGTLLPASIKVVSSVVTAGTRVVTLTRAVVGATKAHFTLPTAPAQLDMIGAAGASGTFGYHAAPGGRGGGSLAMLPKDVDACVCAPHARDLFAYGDDALATWTNYDCVDEPRGDMLRRGDGTGREGVQNNACNMSTYSGGLRCCHHTWFLTDKAQAAETTRPAVDTYYLKWRYYFQEYKPATASAPASHLHLRHWVFLIDESVNDYEESNLVARYGEATVGNITAHVTVDTMGFDIGAGEGPPIDPKWSSVHNFVMTPHCHAPSCIREEFWNEGTKVCSVTANYGDEKYGSLNATFNEANYVAIPPCIFGEQEGLQFPITLKRGTNVTAHKFFNNTYRHLGQMAQWTGLFRFNTDTY